jgi:predicted acylesterase/phospholipase RssA
MFILLPIFCTKHVTAETYPNRISLAISGGASKGAYEAGLIWSLIEVIRQVEKTESWSFGGEPQPLEFAGIAGTSAGGINTLLAALVW